MFNQSNGYSLSDIAAATGREDCDGFGGNGAWWIIILFLFCFAGWGGNRGFGGGNGGAMEGYVLTSDFANIERKLDGVNNGLCQTGYDTLSQFNTTNMGIANGFSRLDTSLCQLGNNITQQTNAIQSQLASCCCETQREIERGFADTNYNLATQECQTRQTINDAARDIVDVNNANTRAIIDFLTQDKIATLTAENQSLRFAASQAEQNNYLVSKLQPCPIPSYSVPNPYVGCGCGYGYNYAIA